MIRNGNDGDHLQDNFDNNSEYGHQQYDQEKDVEPGKNWRCFDFNFNFKSKMQILWRLKQRVDQDLRS